MRSWLSFRPSKLYTKGIMHAKVWTIEGHPGIGYLDRINNSAKKVKWRRK
jgi:hypothetical protein